MAALSQTTAIAKNRNIIRNLNTRLIELEGDVKSLFMNQYNIWNKSEEFKKLLTELINLRKTFNSKYKRIIQLYDKYKLFSLVPNVELELEKRRVAELKNKYFKKKK